MVLTMTRAGRRRQTGLTLVGWLMVILVIGSAATLAVRLIPHYVEYRSSVGSINGLPKDRVHTMSVGEIREALERRFTVNSINDKSVRDVITIDRRRDGTSLLLVYEEREPLIFNVGLILYFDDRFDFE